jgi:hypothetical protein
LLLHSTEFGERRKTTPSLSRKRNKERGRGCVGGLLLMLHGGDEGNCGRAKEEESATDFQNAG